MYTKTSNIKAQSSMKYNEKRNSLLWLLVWLESLLITSNIDRKKSLYSIPPMFSWATPVSQQHQLLWHRRRPVDARAPRADPTTAIYSEIIYPPTVHDREKKPSGERRKERGTTKSAGAFEKLRQ